MGSEMWYVFDFFLKIVVIVVQSGLKLYDLTVMAAGVQMNEFVIASFAQRPGCILRTFSGRSSAWVSKSLGVLAYDRGLWRKAA